MGYVGEIPHLANAESICCCDEVILRRVKAASDSCGGEDCDALFQVAECAIG